MTHRLSLLSERISSNKPKQVTDPIEYFGFDSLLSESEKVFWIIIDRNYVIR